VQDFESWGQVVDALTDPVLIHRGGLVRRANTALEVWLGYERGELVAAPLTRLVACGADGLEAHAGDDSHRCSFLRKDGSLALADVTVSGLGDDVIYVLRPRLCPPTHCDGAVDDLASARATSYLLREILEGIVDRAPVSIWFVDRNGTCTVAAGRVFAAARRAAGIDPDGASRDAILRVFREAGWCRDGVCHALAGQRVHTSGEFQGLSLDVWHIPVHGGRGEVVGAIGVATDVTPQRVLERRLRRAEPLMQLGRRTGLSQLATQRPAPHASCRGVHRCRPSIFAIMPSVDDDPMADGSGEMPLRTDTDPPFSEVAPSLAHEAMNLCGSLRLIELLLREIDAVEVNAKVGILAERLERLGRHLSQYAKASSLGLDEVDLPRALADAVAAVEPIAAQRGVPVNIHASAGSHRVVGDEARLALALSHLIGRVAQRTPAGQPLQISTFVADDPGGEAIGIRISAPGVAADAPNGMFEPFRDRLHGESGLELAIAQRIARAHGGTATAVHDDDRLVLTLTVPAARKGD